MHKDVHNDGDDVHDPVSHFDEHLMAGSAVTDLLVWSVQCCVEYGQYKQHNAPHLYIHLILTLQHFARRTRHRRLLSTFLSKHGQTIDRHRLRRRWRGRACFAGQLSSLDNGRCKPLLCPNVSMKQHANHCAHQRVLQWPIVST